MKIALICPSNLLYMPYVSNYEKILKANKVDYDIINWDRFHIEDTNKKNKYADSKVGHQRNYFDYYRYSRFLLKRLETTHYDKVIVFGIQLSYFLRHTLIKKYHGRYIIDIRDHNKIINLFKINSLIDKSEFIVISSPGYKEWLPNSDKYLVNHNTQISCLEQLKEINFGSQNKKISISFIGATRDYSINIKFIDSLSNSKSINLYFHGEGDINKDISRYLETNDIRNVFLSGRYQKENEKTLYEKSDLINVLRYNDGVNNKTALPNRLYNATLHGKPMIAYEGTYLVEQIKKYKLGLVLDSFEEVDNKIRHYLNNFNIDDYYQGRFLFFRRVIEENCLFENKLTDFLSK